MDLAIGNDADTITSEPGEDAADAFLRAFDTDAETPSEGDEVVKKKPQTPEETNEEPSEETPEDETEGDDGETPEETEKPAASKTRVVLEPDADAYVKFKVDGKDVEIPVKDLARLRGQEAALTRKGQEVAEARTQADANNTKLAAALDGLLTKAIADLKPYAELNFLALAKDPSVTAEDLASLQKQANDRAETVRFLKTQLDETVQAADQARRTNLVKAAGETWKVLADPSTGIKGWSLDTYNEMRTFAKAEGLDARTVDELVDPGALRLIHKAMLYDKGQKAAKTKVVKVDKEPTKIIKTASDQVVGRSKGRAAETAMAKLQRTGSTDDAADYFMSQMQT